MQSSDRLLAHGVDGGLLSAPKGQQEAGEEEEEDSAEVSTDRYSADSGFLLSLSAGMLPLGHARRHTSLLCCSVNSCKTPVATVRLFASACAFICAHMRVSLTCFLCVH